jgi:RND family efflux transporter MFP subunit
MIRNIFVLFLPVMAWLGCNQPQAASNKELERFPVVSPVIVDTTVIKEYVAEISSLQNVEIRTHVKGFVEKIHIDEGQAVQAGQVLFTLSNREFRENLLKATANYKNLVAELKVAEVELKNTGTLADKKIISTSELEVAVAKKEAIEARMDEARAAIAIAQLNLSYTQVKAPFTGVVNRIPFKTGSLVSEGDLLTTISNNREVFAYFNVSEKEFIGMQKLDSGLSSNRVSLMMADNELFPYQGTIETAENVIDRGTGNIAFRARFRNPENILKHGATGKILVREEVPQAMVIPQKATFEIQDKVYVFTVDDSNVIHMRNILPRTRLPHLYVVASGLNEGDRVIYEGIQQVKDGDRIVPEKLSWQQIKFD